MQPQATSTDREPQEPAQPARTAVFLTAEWRHLLMLNFEVERNALGPFVPRGTELDFYQGRTFLSIVGFEFLHTKLSGLRVPFHGDFTEVNLRFYVRSLDEAARRGVVFIKEIVPRRLVTWVARLVYHENYVTAPMQHSIAAADAELEYAWRMKGRWNRIWARAYGDPTLPAPGSLAEFIVEQHWGFSAQPGGGSLEYRVEHPPWRVRSAAESRLDCDVSGVYGRPLAAALQGQPHSVYLVAGSEVTVYRGLPCKGGRA